MTDFIYDGGMMCSHTDGVTAIATPISNSNMIVTASRDRTMIHWDLTPGLYETEFPKDYHKRHYHSSDFDHDVALSANGGFAITGSHDGHLRLWDIHADDAAYKLRFDGHTKGVLSVDFSIDNRHILSASHDRTIKLWNNRGECKYTIEDAHSDAVSYVGFSPNFFHPAIVSASWDCTVKVWDMTNLKPKNSFRHSASVDAFTVSPDGSFYACGGKDGVVYVCHLFDGEEIKTFDFGSSIIIHALCFHPIRCWICIATECNLKIWDLATHNIIIDLRQDHSYCTSLKWSADGTKLFGGCNDGVIQVWLADP